MWAAYNLGIAGESDRKKPTGRAVPNPNALFLFSKTSCDDPIAPSLLVQAMKTSFRILAFGMARDILGRSVMELEWNSPLTVGELREELIRQYPELARLKSLAVAVNSEYAQDGNLLTAGDEIALIPPVSGG